MKNNSGGAALSCGGCVCKQAACFVLVFIFVFTTIFSSWSLLTPAVSYAVNASEVVASDDADTISFGIKRVPINGGASAYYQLTDVNVHVATSATKADEIRSMTLTYPSTLSIDSSSAAAITEAHFSDWNHQSTVLDSTTGANVTNYTMTTPVTAAQAALALSNLRFKSNGNGTDSGSIDITFSADALISWTETDARTGARLRHFYQRVDKDDVVNWLAAYNGARTMTFCGLKGYLCTMIYADEADTITQFTKTPGWFGATRMRNNDSGKTKVGKSSSTGYQVSSISTNIADYYTDGCDTVKNGAAGNNWYWAAGPSWENGRQFYAVGKFGGADGAQDEQNYIDESGKPMFNNWNRTYEPNNSGTNKEYVMQSGFGTPPTKWNDLTYNATSIKSYYVEYSEGWASEGGGTYVPPTSHYAAILPTVVKLEHRQAGTNIKLAADTETAPSTVLDKSGSGGVGNGFLKGQGGTNYGGLSLEGYEWKSAGGDDGKAYLPTTTQTLIYYYGRTEAFETAAGLAFKPERVNNIGGSGLGYRLSGQSVDSGFGKIRYVSVEFPESLTLTTEGAFGSTDWNMQLVDNGATGKKATFRFGDAADYQTAGADPAVVANYLGQLRFAMGGGTQNVTGEIAVTLSDFDNAAGYKRVDELIPQPVTVRYLMKNTTTALKAAEVHYGHIGESVAAQSPASIANYTVNGAASNVPNGAIPYTGAAQVYTWYYDPANGYPVDFDFGAAADQLESRPIYADGISVPNGGRVPEPEDPIAPGWRFDGWYADAGLQTPFDFDTLIGGNGTTLHAKWQQMSDRNIDFEANDGELNVAPGTMPEQQSVKYNSRFNVSRQPVLEGFSFNGWFTEPTGGTQFFPGETRVTGDSESLTLYAHWAIRTTVKYNFIANNNNIATDTMPDSGFAPYNGKVPAPAEAPVAIGASFTGWYTAGTGGTLFDFSGTRITQEVNLYAHWNNQESLNVQFAKGESGDIHVVDNTMPTQQAIAYNAMLPASLPVPAAPGYRFLGWHAEESQYVPGVTRISASLTLIAHWEAADDVSVVFYDNRVTTDGTQTEPGTLPDAISQILYGSSLPTTMKQPVITGYSFEGWYTQSVGGERFILGDDQTANCSRLTQSSTALYAHWAKQPPVSVTFDPMTPSGRTLIAGTTPVNLTALPYNSTIDPVKPAALSARFEGWFYQDADDNEFPFQTGPDGDRVTSSLQLYGKWSIVGSVDVKFDPNPPAGKTVIAGTVPANLIEKEYNSVLPADAVLPGFRPEVEGWRFDGWYTAATGGTVVTFGSSRIDGTIIPSGDEATRNFVKLYAHWTQADPVNVSYDKGSVDSVVAGTMPAGSSYPYSTAIGSAPALSPESVGYAFSRWYTTGGAIYDFGTRLSSDITLVARWNPAADNALIYDGNAGTDNVINLPPQRTVSYSAILGAAPEQVPIRLGYQFARWLDAPAGTIFDFATKRIKATTHVYADWTKKADLTLVFSGGNSNIIAGTTPTGNAITVPYHGVLPPTMTVPQAIGYRFDGWYSLPLGQGTEYLSGITRFTESCNLYGAWTEMPDHKVSFDANTAMAGGGTVQDGTLPAEKTGIKYNGGILAPTQTPVISGYQFLGWYRDAEGNDPFDFKSGTDHPGTMTREDITLYAKWKPMDGLTIQYHANPPQGVEASQVFALPFEGSGNQETNHAFNAPLSAGLSSPRLAGYAFLGWFTTADGGDQYVPGSGLRVTEDMALYAHWQRRSDVAVMFSALKKPVGSKIEDSLPDDLLLPYDSLVPAPNPPVILGYRFAQWYRDRDLSQPFDFDGDRVTEDTTLYGKWTAAANVSVVFDGNKPAAATESVTGVPAGYSNVIFGARIAAMATSPVLPGYHFEGWVTTNGALSTEELEDWSYDFASGRVAPTSGTVFTLYASWTVKAAVSLSFDMNKPAGATDTVQGAPADRPSLPADSVAVAPDGSPTLDGYTFIGWFADADCNQPFTFGSARLSAPATTVYAGWQEKEPSTYSLTYVGVAPDGGEAIVSGTMPFPSTITTTGSAPIPQPVDPISVGFHFDGWYDAPQGGNLIDFSSGITADSYAFTRWQARSPVSVQFDANAGGDSVPLAPNQNIPYNGTIAAPTSDPVRAGWRFLGWFTVNSGVDPEELEDYRFDFDTRLTAATTLYAWWTVETPRNITFSANKPGPAIGIVRNMPAATQTAYHGTFSCPEDVPKLYGYRFIGWYKGAEETADAFAFDTELVQDDMTLYAHWEAKAPVPVTFESNAPAAGVSITGMPESPLDVTYGNTVEAPVTSPVAVGYSFAGWKTTASGGMPYDFAGTPITDATRIYAAWTPHAEVGIYFNLNVSQAGSGILIEGTRPDDRRDQPYSMVFPDDLVTPRILGYRFTGWFDTAADSGGRQYIPGETIIYESMTAYARWVQETPINLYFIENADGQPVVTFPDGLLNLPVNSRMNTPADPVRQGYRFTGWYDAATGGNPIVIAGRYFTEDTNLYAHWEAKQDVTLTFVGNKPAGAGVPEVEADTLPAAQILPYQGIATAPTKTPVLVGYRFDGWYTDNRGNSPADFGSRLTEDTNVYAKWVAEPQTYTLHFDNMGNLTTGTLLPGTAATDVSGLRYNQAVQPPAQTPEMVGYRFNGWYTTKGAVELAPYAYDFGGRMTENRNLYADWTAASDATLVFVGNNGNHDVTQLPAPQTVRYSEKATAPPVEPFSLGYKFDGWWTGAGAGSQSFDFDKTIRTEGTLNLYAHWIAMDEPVITWSTDRDGLESGSFPESGPVAYGTILTMPSAPHRAGYQFDGWYADASLQTAFVWGGRATADVTIYAGWTVQAGSFHVNYYLHIPAGQTVIGDITADQLGLSKQYGERILLPTLLIEGYRFDGWWDQEAGPGGSEYIGALYAEANQDVHGRWTKMNDLALTLNLGAGMAPQTVMVKYNTFPTQPANPVQAGQIFGGWYADPACQTVYRFDGARLTEPATVYAKWTAEAAKPDPEQEPKPDDGSGTGPGPQPQPQPEPEPYTEPVAAPDVIKIRTPMTAVALSLKKSVVIPIVLDGPANTVLRDVLTWTSSNPKVATVTAAGKVSAKAAGKATITVKTQNGRALNIKVTVAKKSVALKKLAVTGWAKKKTMKANQTGQLKLNITPKGATNLKVTFKSNKAAGLSIDKAGKLVAKKKGKYTITVKVGNKTIKTTITVK